MANDQSMDVPSHSQSLAGDTGGGSAGRDGVAEGFSRASYASLIFLALAFLASTRMPREITS